MAAVMWKTLLPTLAGKTLVEHDPSGQFADIESTITGFTLDNDYVEIHTTRGGFGGDRRYLGAAGDGKGNLVITSPWFRATVK